MQRLNDLLQLRVVLNCPPLVLRTLFVPASGSRLSATRAFSVLWKVRSCMPTTTSCKMVLLLLCDAVLWQDGSSTVVVGSNITDWITRAYNRSLARGMLNGSQNIIYVSRQQQMRVQPSQTLSAPGVCEAKCKQTQTLCDLQAATTSCAE